MFGGGKFKRLPDFLEKFRNVITNPIERFTLIVDLGIIIVPFDYKHATQLGRFGMQNRSKFYFNENIIDGNFPNPSRILKSGDKIHVRVFKQVVDGITTNEERLAFLASQNAFFAGAQGASLVFEQKRDMLPDGPRYLSLDEKNRLWKDAAEFHRVPCIGSKSSAVFGLGLDLFENTSDSSACIIGFFDE
ncbi:MAG: hypothetical protein WC087_01595 [Candidatus Paceibacterota bacterium]